ncbi:hypothetical protein ACFXO9_14370 [Nocardia tengchongensis]|uniref:hypothetical protein n=1 Tax=Nocardia tengchongensis TaxID=2055889 RepID=UPI00368B544F
MAKGALDAVVADFVDFPATPARPKQPPHDNTKPATRIHGHSFRFFGTGGWG